MKLFAYGALMSPAYTQLIGIDPSSRVGAVLENYKLSFTKQAKNNPQQGFATITEDTNEKIYGIVYDLSEKDIAMIDKTEDYPIGYTREEVTVTMQNGEHMKVNTYIATPHTLHENLLPTKEYIGLICESTDLLPADYIENMKHVPTLD